MRMCPNCRTRVNEGDMFCQTCGTPTVATEENVAPRRAPNVRCPQCGETQALKSSIVAAGKCSRVYWMCRTCRNKFRDPKDLEKELRNMKNPIATLVVNFVCVIFGFVMFAMGCSRLAEYNRLDYFTKMANEGYKSFSWYLIVFGMIVAVVGLFSAMIYARKYADLQQEKRELNGNLNQRNRM